MDAHVVMAMGALTCMVGNAGDAGNANIAGIAHHGAATIVGATLVVARIGMHCRATSAMIAMHGRCGAMRAMRAMRAMWAMRTMWGIAGTHTDHAPTIRAWSVWGNVGDVAYSLFGEAPHTSGSTRCTTGCDSWLYSGNTSSQ